MRVLSGLKGRLPPKEPGKRSDSLASERKKRLILLAGSPLEQNRAHKCGAQNDDKGTNEDQNVDHEGSSLLGTSPSSSGTTLKAGFLHPFVTVAIQK
jgi:hypothetical protein